LNVKQRVSAKKIYKEQGNLAYYRYNNISAVKTRASITNFSMKTRIRDLNSCIEIVNELHTNVCTPNPLK